MCAWIQVVHCPSTNSSSSYFLLFRAARMARVIFVGEKSGLLFRCSFELS